MLDHGHTSRQCFTVYRPGDSDGESAAALMVEAAATLQTLGRAIVRHIEFDTIDDSRRSEIALTVYFDGQ